MIDTFGAYWIFNIYNRQYILNIIKKLMGLQEEEKIDFLDKLKLGEEIRKRYQLDTFAKDFTSFVYAW